MSNTEIIAQSITSGFTTDSLYQHYYSTSKYAKLAGNMLFINDNFHLIDSGVTIFGLMINSLEDINTELKELMIFSETLEKSEILKLMTDIRMKFIEYYNNENMDKLNSNL